jgi:O-methyltransferase involved in polyketide biosynthesis
MAETLPPKIDMSQPNVARVYDYLLGGKDNFSSDRELAEQLLGIVPGMRESARDNRAFVCAAVARAAEGGVTQFLDLGAGLPTHPATHEAAREINPDARVAYVDIDPVAVIHAQSLLAKGDGVTAFRADLTDPAAVLARLDLAGMLDLSQPTGIIIAGVAHFVAADLMRELTAAYLARVPAGSWLIISVGHVEDESTTTTLQPAYTAAETFHHSLADFTSFFTGTDIVPPGIVEARRWIAGVSAPPPQHGVYVLTGAGIKR